MLDKDIETQNELIASCISVMNSTIREIGCHVILTIVCCHNTEGKMDRIEVINNEKDTLHEIVIKVKALLESLEKGVTH
jgi:hypothetical protein